MNYNRARTTPTHRLRSRASDRTPSFRPAEGDEAEKAWERTDQALPSFHRSATYREQPFARTATRAVPTPAGHKALTQLGACEGEPESLAFAALQRPVGQSTLPLALLLVLEEDVNEGAAAVQPS